MKFPSSYAEARAPCANMEKDLLSAAATAAKQIPNNTKASPLKEHIIPAKPQFTPVDATTEFSLNKGPQRDDKENDGHNKGEPLILGKVLQDSGYLSLYNSRNDEHGSEQEHSTPTKLCLKSWKKWSQNSLSSTTTPLSQSDHRNLLPMATFQQAVCEGLKKSFHKSNGYGWSVVVTFVPGTPLPDLWADFMMCKSPSELVMMGYEEARAPCGNMERELSAAATAASPLKELIKPQFTPTDVTTDLFSLNKGPVDDKENDGHNNREPLILAEVLQDSGYLSLYTSQSDVEHGSEEELSTPTQLCRRKSRSALRRSPSKCKTAVAHSGTRTPKMCHWKKRSQNSPSSTITTALCQIDHHNLLPIVKFQQDVCEKLKKSFQKSKRYDWSVVDQVAESHLLDRVIGGHVGREYVDVFSSLLSRNMRAMLANLLALLGDMDLISCSQVSRSWRQIIAEDTAALHRCQQAQAMLKESQNSSGQENWCIVTRVVAVSRVVLSSVQSLAASSTSSSSSSATPNYRAGRSAPSSTSATPNSCIYRSGRPVLSSSSATPNYRAGRPVLSSSSATPIYRAGRPAPSSSATPDSSSGTPNSSATPIYRAGRPAPSSSVTPDSSSGTPNSSATPNYRAGRPAPSSSATPNSSATPINIYRAGRLAPPSSQKCNDSRVSEYIQVAGGLKQHESLRSCIRCGSPAKHLVEAQRAACTRTSCGFEFCTCCHETFHGSTPCRTVMPRIARHAKMSSILPGSARSKRNVRRL